jgi:hypothetical protein
MAMNSRASGNGAAAGAARNEGRRVWRIGRVAPEAWLAAPVVALVVVLAACGGGVDSGGTGAAPATLAVGPISGYGSIVVGGVHYDETSARISDEDEQPLDASALELGVVATIEASAVVSNNGRLEATAERIRVGAELVGPVDAVDAARSSVTVLGQQVAVPTSTVFEKSLSGDLAALHPGDVLAVYGQQDTAGRRIVATRIEPRPLATVYVLRAPVDSYSRDARALVLGGTVISLAGLSADALPETLATGSLARARLRTEQQDGAWVALSLQANPLTVDSRENVEIEGRITAFTSPQQFSVAGVAVDASAAEFPNGTGGLTPGARVEVEGRASAGTIIARSVKLESDDAGSADPLEIEGRISALDTVAQTFVVHDVTVSYANVPGFNPADVQHTDGSFAWVSVRGRLSADRTIVIATSIEIEH